ncbi:MAG: signal recognition particle receptor subunit alpha [Candidatus Aenigmarchaeota archaeon]|nr:signal recognition particle receptor subunit alpha [Candidatus Aenigmarchaeota archaeon]
MFGFLKKKLKESVNKLKQIAKKEEPNIEDIEQAVSEIQQEKPVLPAKEEIIEEKIEIKEEIEKIEEIPVKVDTKKIEKIKVKELEPEVKEIEKKEQKPEKEMHPKGAKKENIFKKIQRKITEKEIKEEDIKDILWDMQISLMQSDVALEVAEKIINDIKNSLIGKPAKKKEIEKIVYNTLKQSISEILDIPKINLLEKVKEEKPFKIIFLGFNGSGKCVSGDTLIPLSDGRIIKIKDLYNTYKKLLKERKINDGFILNSKKTGLKTFSINPKTLKIEESAIENMWKLEKKDLFKITIENGQEIKVTPEHPFFVLKEGKIEKIRADRLSEYQYIMVPRSIGNQREKLNNSDILEIISDKKLFIHNKKMVKNIYNTLEKAYGNIKKAFEQLEIPISFNTFAYYRKEKCIISADCLVKIIKKHKHIKNMINKQQLIISYNGSKKIQLPKLNRMFAKFLGYISGEGYIYNNYIEFTNSDNNILKDFEILSKKLFNIELKLEYDKRKPSIKFYRLNNSALSFIIGKMIKKKKGKEIEIDNRLFRLSNDFWSGFINSYFDSDGYIQKNTRNIEILTKSKTFSKQLSMMLLRFGIIASYGKKNINGKEYYRIYITGKSKLEKFISIINPISVEKKRRLNNISALPYQFEITELIPHQGRLLKNSRIKSNLYQINLSNNLGVAHSLICQYETYDTMIPRDKLKNMINVIQKPNKFLETLCNSDVSWLRVKKIEKIKNKDKYVYDLTIRNNHNFIANNFIVHNTTSLAKVGNYLKNNGLKCIFAAADTWRAASIEQIEDHGNRLGIKVIKQKYLADPAAVIFDAVKHAQSNDIDVVLADTAGRSHANKNLMDELKKIIRVNNPNLKIMVIDALTGNDVVEQIKLFDDAVSIDCIILTKTDAYEKGGAILSAAYTSKKPILFLGTGQEYNQFELFDKDKIISNLLEQ